MSAGAQLYGAQLTQVRIERKLIQDWVGQLVYQGYDFEELMVALREMPLRDHGRLGQALWCAWTLFWAFSNQQEL